jgi:RNA polymerase sigma-70 factor (ECF subfamily)
VFSRFHAEAGIAAAHCFAPSFKETRWAEIADLYTMLERVDPSPLNIMNQAVAVAEWQGPEAGLALLQAVVPPSWLSGSYLWDAVMSDLHRRAGKLEIARQHMDRALASAPTEAAGPPPTQADNTGPSSGWRKSGTPNRSWLDSISLTL